MTDIMKLFSLTSVKEARESRLLSENVRLLTYVTVFYLPLTLCAVSPPSARVSLDAPASGI